MIKNKVGLEAEFLLRDKEGKLLYPGDNGFSTDEFIILGEFRADPGETREETLANFMKEMYKTKFTAKKKDLQIDFSGEADITPEIFSEIVKRMGHKALSTCENIYNTDITKLSDAVIKGGKILSYKLSCGLHVHFSSSETVTVVHEDIKYVRADIPEFSLGKGTTINFGELFKKTEVKQKEDASASANRITQPVIDKFVGVFDIEILPKLKSKSELKFRKPGFYERKGYGGFEYRSLPMNLNSIANIEWIVDKAFSLLEAL